MKKQRLLGLLLILLSLLVIVIALGGTTPEESDATAVLFLLPLGLYALVTKNYILQGTLPKEQKKATSKAATLADGRTKQ